MSVPMSGTNVPEGGTGRVSAAPELHDAHVEDFLVWLGDDAEYEEQRAALDHEFEMQSPAYLAGRL
jgi:hypothetical protein